MEQIAGRTLFTLYILLLCLLAGCSEGPGAQQGARAPAISCTDISGDYFNLGTLKHKTVLVYFWSSKCCGESLKKLEPVYQRYQDRGLAIVAVEVGGTKEAVQPFVTKNAFSFTNLTDEYQSISRSYRVIGFPTLFLIDKKRIVRSRISGETKPKQLEQVLEPLLSEP